MLFLGRWLVAYVVCVNYPTSDPLRNPELGFLGWGPNPKLYQKALYSRLPQQHVPKRDWLLRAVKKLRTPNGFGVG